MKPNLKTYPKDGKWMSAFKWKEAFEKELQQLNKDDRKKIGKTPHAKMQWHLGGRIKARNEILGVTQLGKEELVEPSMIPDPTEGEN